MVSTYLRKDNGFAARRIEEGRIVDWSRTTEYKGNFIFGRMAIQANDALKQDHRGSFHVGRHPSVRILLTDKDRALRSRMLVEVCIDVRNR